MRAGRTLSCPLCPTESLFPSSPCDFSVEQIMESPSVLLSGMGGSSLGVWVAHAEGRVHFPDPASRKSAIDGALAPMRYRSLARVR